MQSCVIPLFTLQMGVRKRKTKYCRDPNNHSLQWEYPQTNKNIKLLEKRKTVNNKYNVTNAFSCLWDLAKMANSKLSTKTVHYWSLCLRPSLKRWAAKGWNADLSHQKIAISCTKLAMTCALLTETPWAAAALPVHCATRHRDHPENVKSTDRHHTTWQTLAWKYGPMSLSTIKCPHSFSEACIMFLHSLSNVPRKLWVIRGNTKCNLNCLQYTVGAIIIWSLVDFVGLPTYKEWN